MVKCKPPRLSASDAKVMAVSLGLLNRPCARVVTHSNIAQATGIPLGSRGWSLRTLAGLIKEGPKGAFRLAWAGSRRLRRAGGLPHITDPPGALLGRCGKISIIGRSNLNEKATLRQARVARVRRTGLNIILSKKIQQSPYKIQVFTPCKSKVHVWACRRIKNPSGIDNQYVGFHRFTSNRFSGMDLQR